MHYPPECHEQLLLFSQDVRTEMIITFLRTKFKCFIIRSDVKWNELVFLGLHSPFKIYHAADCFGTVAHTLLQFEELKATLKGTY